MKKLLALLLALCLVSGLIGCAAPTVPDASEPPEASVTETPQGEVTEIPVVTEPVELTFWHSMDGVYAEIVDKQVAAFNEGIGKEKGIQVTAVFQDWPGTDALTAAMAADDVENMPDVIQLYSESVSLVRDYERTVWAEDYITAPDATVTKADLIPNTVNAYTVGGKMIGVPYNISALLLYYNKTCLEQAGYSEPPKTIAEMASMLPVIVDKTDAEFGLNVRVQSFELENWIVTQGAGGSYLGNNDGGRSEPMTELACEDTLHAFLTEWQKVVDSGAYKSVRDSINEEFAAGMHGMVVMTSSRILTIKDLVGDAFAWGVTAIPKVNEADIGGAYPSGGGLFMLDRGDEAKKNASWEFVQYMIGAQAQTMWLEGTGYVPVNVHTSELDSYKQIVAAEPRLAVPFEVLNASPANAVASFSPNSSEIDSVIKNAMLLMGDGTNKADATFTAIWDGCKQAIDDYYRANPIG